jgi:hypothetical protein
MKKTDAGDLWRTAGDTIMVLEPCGGPKADVYLTMEDLRAMAMELGRHLGTLPLDPNEHKPCQQCGEMVYARGASHCSLACKLLDKLQEQESGGS